MYPKGDTEYEEAPIQDVIEAAGGGWLIAYSDNWFFYVPEDVSVEPAVGMLVRVYGKGIGHGIRGLFVDGKKVFYRSENEGKGSPTSEPN